MCTQILPSCIDLPIDNKELKELVLKAKDWAIMHGAAMRSKKNFSLDTVNFAPFILTPTSFPRKEFDKAVKLQPILNELMHKVAYDEEFLRTTLRETIQADKFTENLFKIYDSVMNSGLSQTLSLGLLRSDLMLEYRCPELNLFNSQAYCCLKQVEINTIASGFGHLGPISRGIQSYVLHELDAKNLLTNLPENEALSGLSGALVKAWEVFDDTKSVILFVIEDISYNICDQRFHEFEIRKMNSKIKVIRKTLTEINKEGLLGPKNELIVDNFTVGVVYFRAGYEPNHYSSQNEWDARQLIEFSTAIKCPSIQYHLSGTKKVQQALATPGILKRFIDDDEKIEMIKDIFTGLYTLDCNEAGNAAYEMALKDPKRFVLKPQREGGGNNIYGEEIRDVLLKMHPTERQGWILMDRIFPPITKGYMIRPGDEVPPNLLDLVSELGIFGAIMGDSKKILFNYQSGHMLRSKLSTENEGGVAAGQGALDSPFLID